MSSRRRHSFLLTLALGVAATPTARAVDWRAQGHQLVQAGDFAGLTRLARQMLRTDTSPPARRLARNMLEHASRNGEEAAALTLAKIHLRGLFGFPASKQHARPHVARAAALGSETARRWLARNPAPEPTVLVVEGSPPSPPPPPVRRGRIVRRGDPSPPGMSPIADLKTTRKVRIFSSPHCPPCRVYEPMARRYFARRPDIDFEIVDITSDPGSNEADRYDVDATPTTIAFGRGRDLLSRMLGPRTEEELAGLFGEPSS